jgi:hypothetical protein
VTSTKPHPSPAKQQLDRLEKLLSMVARCERLIAMQASARDQPDRPPEVLRAVADLRIELASEERYNAVARTLAEPSIDGLRIALIALRTAISEQQRKLLSSGARVA